MPQPHRQGFAQKETLIALGGNVTSHRGPPAVTLQAALVGIGRHIGPVTGKSRIWRTPAYPPGSGADYANAACRVLTALPADAILTALHAIEAGFGRLRETRWGARTLDLDLIAIGDTVRPDAATQTAWRDIPPQQQAREAPGELILPHPRLQDRAFVLVPLAEVAADWRHPVTGLTVAAMLAALPAADIAAMQPMDAGM